MEWAFNRRTEISYFIKNILICSLKINESLLDLERHLLMQRYTSCVQGSLWCAWWLYITHPPVRKLCCDKPVSRHVEHVQLCSLWELGRDAHQTVLSHTQNIQTAAAADLRQITKTTSKFPCDNCKTLRKSAHYPVTRAHNISSASIQILAGTWLRRQSNEHNELNTAALNSKRTFPK